MENTYFYSFYNDDELINCIYLYQKDEKLFLNAFAKRGNHLFNLECLRQVLSWFNCDIYAQTIQKTAILCICKCGFKKIDDNLYIYERV